MDLISREAAIKFAKEQMVKETGAYSKGRNSALLVMKSALNNPDAIPSVDAVPLDKLCEWLADHCEPPVNMTEDWEQMEQDARAAIWRWVLEKGLEEQDAHEQQAGK